MKNIIFILSFLFYFTLSAQDTTLLMQYPDGASMIEIRTKTDTVQISYYSADKIESTFKKDPVSKRTLYTRYYRNGKKMWEKQVYNDIEYGNCTFYNTSGKKIAEYIILNGVIRDTLFVDKKSPILFGSLHYSSTVYGGMENEDGTSNVSTVSGPYIHYHMKLLPLDYPKESKHLPEYYFTSDYKGEFIVVLKPGKYGMFDKNFDSKKITSGQYKPFDKFDKNGNSHWDNEGPITIQKNSAINYVNLEHTTVGYAP